jgi:hypothetical protein
MRRDEKRPGLDLVLTTPLWKPLGVYGYWDEDGWSGTGNAWRLVSYRAVFLLPAFYPDTAITRREIWPTNSLTHSLTHTLTHSLDDNTFHCTQFCPGQSTQHSWAACWMTQCNVRLVGWLLQHGTALHACPERHYCTAQTALTALTALHCTVMASHQQYNLRYVYILSAKLFSAKWLQFIGHRSVIFVANHSSCEKCSAVQCSASGLDGVMAGSMASLQCDKSVTRVESEQCPRIRSSVAARVW